MWIIIVVIVIVVAVLSAFVVTYTSYHYTQVTSLTGSTTTYESEEFSNISYCTIDNMTEQLNLYIPLSILNSGAYENAPLVMYVHGGGWVEGTDQQDWNGIFQMLLANNFVVASVNYYLVNASASPNGFPVNIEDVACALRFLRFNAATYHINPDHVGLLGDSAGGNLVSLLALSSLNGTFDKVGGYTAESDQVQAVVDCFGPANITDPPFRNNQGLYHWGTYHLNLFQVVFGNSNSSMEQASPVNYVKAGDPPFLIEQGVNDTTVPMSQSVELYNSLNTHNDSVNLILVQNSGHEFLQINPSKPLSPNLEQLLSDIMDFFNSKLK
jgi:acetyl esterase/lipase